MADTSGVSSELSSLIPDQSKESLIFTENEKIFAFHQGMLYEAKVRRNSFLFEAFLSFLTFIIQNNNLNQKINEIMFIKLINKILVM